MNRARLPALLSVALILPGCEQAANDQLENQMMLMQERLVELETQVADGQALGTRLAGSVGELEAYLGDVESAVIDLSAFVSRDLLVDVEATLSNAKGKLQEVRARSDALGAALRPIEAELEE